MINSEAVQADTGRALTEQTAPRIRRPRISLAVVRALLDVITVGAATSLAFPLRFRWDVLSFSDPAPFDATAYLVAAALWVIGVVGAMASHRLYDEDTLGSDGNEMRRIRHAVLEGVALVATAVFLLKLVSVSRGWFLITVVLSVVLLVAERRGVRKILESMRARGRMRRPCILVTAGSASSFEELAGSEFRVVATVDPSDAKSVSEWTRHLPAGSQPPVVVVDADAVLPRDDLWQLVVEAGHAGSAVFVCSPIRPLPTERLSTRTVGGSTMVKVSPPTLHGARAIQKRALDLMAALALCVLFAIPMALTALAVLITSGRPILYGQLRVGKDGRPFRMWKFRTMRDGAETNSGPVWATADDPRCTAVGRILRRLSIDEIPQLWNVLVGDMSIVGPRPERPFFVARFGEGNPWYGFRHRIRPGITGLAQVNGLRGDTPLEPRVELDNWYIEHWSVGLDVRIAARTALEVLRGRNAH